MTQNVCIYYVPQNLNISKGKIYNIYLNKITNLDLSSIIEKKEITLNGILQPNKEIISTPQPNNTIPLSKEDYNNILQMADATVKLYNQSQALVKKLTQGSGIK